MNRTFFYNQLSINGYHVKEGIIPFKKRVFLTIEGPYRFMWTMDPKNGPQVDPIQRTPEGTFPMYFS